MQRGFVGAAQGQVSECVPTAAKGATASLGLPKEFKPLLVLVEICFNSDSVPKLVQIPDLLETSKYAYCKTSYYSDTFDGCSSSF